MGQSEGRLRCTVLPAPAGPQEGQRGIYMYLKAAEGPLRPHRHRSMGTEISAF